jgi:hypothetical protein
MSTLASHEVRADPVNRWTFDGSTRIFRDPGTTLPPETSSRVFQNP